VVGASVTVDGTQDLVTVELTLETRIQLFVERMNVLLQKIGASADAQVLTAPGAISQVVLQSPNSTAVNTFTQTIGDGGTAAFTIGHGLGTQNVTVSVRNVSTGAYLNQASGAGNFTITSSTLNSLVITFGTAPAINGVTVVVKK
jgi:hypothetical protein